MFWRVDEKSAIRKLMASQTAVNSLIKTAALFVGAALLPLLVLAGFIAMLLAALGAGAGALLRGEAALFAAAQLLMRVEPFQQELCGGDDLFGRVFLRDAEW